MDLGYERSSRTPQESLRLGLYPDSIKVSLAAKVGFSEFFYVPFTDQILGNYAPIRAGEIDAGFQNIALAGRCEPAKLEPLCLHSPCVGV